MYDIHGDVVVVNTVLLFSLFVGFTLSMIALLYTMGHKWFKGFMTKRQRRKAHLKYVQDTIVQLRFKIINLTLACERGDLSLVAFNRRVLNAAVLIRRYETKLGHLNRLIR